MTIERFYVSGKVLERQSREGVANVRVEVWDKDIRYHSLLGVIQTDQSGFFEVDYDNTYFGDYGPDRLPDLFFKVFHGPNLIKSTAGAVMWNAKQREVDLEILVDIPYGLPSSSESTEVAMHELGESIAVALASVQEELAKYPNSMGTFIVDEVEVDIPVQLRVDGLGQVMTTVVNQQISSEELGKLRFKIKPVLGAQVPQINSSQSLRQLGGLTEEEISKLESQRIFSVDDLLRVTRNPAGQAAFNKVGIKTPLSEILDRAAILKVPEIPVGVKETLIQLGIRSPKEFVKFNSNKLARLISRKLDQQITPDLLKDWQRVVSDRLKRF